MEKNLILTETSEDKRYYELQDQIFVLEKRQRLVFEKIDKAEKELKKLKEFDYEYKIFSFFKEEKYTIILLCSYIFLIIFTTIIYFIIKKMS